MPEPIKIDPKDFVPASRTVTKIDPSEFTPAASAAVAPTTPPSSASIMDPHPIRSGVRRIGRSIGDVTSKLDPTRPENVPQTAQLAVGVGLPLAASAVAGPEAAPLTRVAAQGVAGLLQPYAQYATARAMGQHPEMPGLYDAARSGAFNAGFAGLSELSGTAKAVGPEMEGAPKTIGQLNQAIRNRDFWHQVGMSDTDIDNVLRLPDNELTALARQIKSGNDTRQAFQNVVDHTRGIFRDRYSTTLGSQANSAVDAPAIATQMRTIAEGQGQHELTPTFQKFLLRKADELEGAGGRVKDPLAPVDARGKARYLDPNDPKSAQLIEKMRKQGITDPGRGFDVQDARDLRTELRENLPAGATQLDKQAMQQLNESVSQHLEKSILDNGGTTEQIGAMKAIDADYGRFQEMLKTLDPRDEKYGTNVANALFDPMLKNPGAGLEFINMAKAADAAKPGTMDTLREAFTQKTLELSSRAGSPTNQMEVLRKLQQQWGDNGSRSILSALYGKDSPMANPVTFAKVVGSPVDPEKVNQISQFFSRSVRSPWLLRGAALYAVTGGSPMKAIQDPSQWPKIVGTLLSLEYGGRLLGHLNNFGQEKWVNFKLNPTPDTFKTFMRASGAMIGAGSTLPGEETSP